MSESIKTFTRAELAKNVGTRLAEDDRPSSEQMLIAIDNYVYDLTKFESLHPGGKAVLRMVAGEDTTEQFYALHTKDVLEKYHKRLCVGVLVDDGAKPTQTDLKYPATSGEDLVSSIPYAEMPLMRPNWAKSPWWNESHRAFLVGFREKINSILTTYMKSSVQMIMFPTRCSKSWVRVASLLA
jgi:predicted heme/steroid binding protein